MQPQHLGHACPQKSAVVLLGRKAAKVHRPEVHRRFAAHNPFGQHFARTTGTGDASRVKPSGDKTIVHFGCLADDKIIVRRKALWPVDKFYKVGVGQGGNAVFAGLKRLGKFGPVRLKQLKREVVGNSIDQPRFGVGLERAQHNRITLWAKVERIVRVAAHRQIGVGAGDRFANNVVVFDRVKRNLDASAQGQVARPHATTEDNNFTLDRAQGGFHARRPAILV